MLDGRMLPIGEGRCPAIERVPQFCILRPGFCILVAMRRVVAVLATAQFLVAAAALVNEYVKFCAGCAERGSVPIAVAGAAFYLHLAVLAWLGRHESAVRALAFVALGAHSAMSAFQIQESMNCKLCWAAFGGSALLALAAFLQRPREFGLPVLTWPVGAAVACAALPFLVPTGTLVRADEGARVPDAMAGGIEAGEIVVFLDLRCRRCAGFMEFEAKKIEQDYVETGLAKIRYAIVDPQNEVFRMAVRFAYGAALDGKDREVLAALFNTPTLAFDPPAVLNRLAEIVPKERLVVLADDPDVLVRMNADFAWARQLHVVRAPTIFARPAGSRDGKVLARWRTLNELLVFIDQTVRSKK